MVIEIATLIITPLTGLLGVFVGARLARSNEVKIRKEFIARELKIEKYQELSSYLHEYIRKIASMDSAVRQLVFSEISHEEFQVKNNQFQEEALNIQRKISINKIFVKDLKDELNKFVDNYTRYCDRIYDGFHKPNNRNPVFEKSEVTRDEIFHEMIRCTNLGMEVIENIESKVEKELSGLLK